MVETQADDILSGADKEDVSLLVVGDPFGCVHSNSYSFPSGHLHLSTRPIRTFQCGT